MKDFKSFVQKILFNEDNQENLEDPEQKDKKDEPKKSVDHLQNLSLDWAKYSEELLITIALALFESIPT